LWEFWSDDVGFDKAAWLVRYKSLRQSERRKLEAGHPHPVSVTRQRIERFVEAAQPTWVLETNLYGFPSPSEHGLRKPDRDVTTFEFLLSEIRPDVLVLHGSAVRSYFERRYDCLLEPMFSKVVVNGRAIWVAAMRHFSLVSFQLAEQLGTEADCVAPPHSDPAGLSEGIVCMMSKQTRRPQMPVTRQSASAASMVDQIGRAIAKGDGLRQ
jgi:hypothetical protein